MSKFIPSTTKKAVSLLVAVMMLFGAIGAPVAYAAALTADQIDAIVTLLSTFGADQATIDNVKSALNGEAVSATPGSGSSSSVCPYTWTTNLTTGSTGNDVLNLQKFLNADSDTVLASSGAGSPGSETSFFGSVTAGGVTAFQNKFASEILAPVGLSTGTGFFGPSTRAKANELCAAAPTTPATPTTPTTPTAPVPLGTGLTVTAPAQPENALAPGNTTAQATRVPFTNIDLTASADGPVTVDSISVELNSLADDSDFENVMLMNEDGTIIGIPKSFDSNDQAKVGTAFTIPAGTTKRVVIGGTIATTPNSGITAIIKVIAINTSATVNGSLPIIGATHTLNDTLIIGTIATLTRGALDPGANRGSLEVGKTGFNAAGVKITAGSKEDVLVKSIRWFQTGSVSSDDIINVVTVVDGVSHPTTRVGDYYTTTFDGEGLLMEKGFSKDFTIRVDIVAGSARTIDFDIDRREDIQIVGKKFGYGILPPAGTDSSGTDDGAFHTTNNPWYDAFQHTISAGTLQVSSWTAGVPAQNVAENVADQPIAGFTVDVNGEAVTVGTMTVQFNVTGSANTSDITNAVIVNESGTVLAGPVDGSGTAKFQQFSFSDTVTFPVGITNLFIKAKLSTDFANNDTVAASTTPTNWSNVTGDITGDTITPTPSSAVTGQTQTVKAGSLSISTSAQPSARNVIAGASQFEFARFIFDAGQSGEDVRITSLPIEYNFTGGATADLTNCKLYDGSAPVTTGSNVVDPSVATAASETFTLDGNGALIAKGVTKTFSLKCDVSASASSGNTVTWALDTSDTFSGVTGVVSGQSITPSINSTNEQAMTVATSGTYTVTADTGVLFTMARAGTSNVTLGKLRFEAGASEAVDIKQIALQLSNVATNSPSDLVNQEVTLWHNGVQVGTGQFPVGDNATSTLSIPVRVGAGDTETVTIKGSLLAHNVNEGQPGAILAVDYDGNNNGLNGNYATGADSGSTISGTSGDTSTNGVSIFRAVPTISDVTTTYNASKDLGAGQNLYAFRVDNTASSRDILIHAVTFSVQSVGAGAISGWQLFGQSNAVNATGFSTTTDTNISAGDRLRIVFDNANTDRIVSAGTSQDYRLQATTINGLTSTNVETVSIALLQDTAGIGITGNLFATQGYAMASTSAIETSSAGNASTTDRFIWSPGSTTTVVASSAYNLRDDFTNSYGMPGFPGPGQPLQTQVFKD